MTRVALAGYGLAGRDIHAPLLAEAGCEVVAVSTRNPERAAAALADLPGVRVAAGLDGLLAPALLGHRTPPLPAHLVPERRAHQAVGHDSRHGGVLGVEAPVLEDGERDPCRCGIPHDGCPG